MPGTIHVTVLEFKGVSSSSSSKPSAKSLKVSMGKRQYQTWDKGDFSFPITKLREDLVVALLDAGGNEIARADIRTMQVMEKGSWDEVFPINGSGNVHMKLQFVLSDEERNRIRIMRESAVKKKLEMNPSINLRLSESFNASRDSVETSTKYEQKVSDSQKGIVEIDVMSTKVEASQAGSSLTSAASSALSLSIYPNEGQSILETAIPNATDISQSAPSSPDKHRIEVEPPQVHKMVPDEKIETQLLANIRSEIEEESTPSMSDKKNSVVSKLQDDPVKKSDSGGPLKKIPSNVRKMISAFENTKVQEVKSLKKASSVPYQLNRFRMEGLLEGKESKTVLHPPVKSSRNFKDQFAGNLRQAQTAFSVKSQPPKELTSTVTTISTEGNNSITEDVPSTASKESTMEEVERSPVDLLRQSTSETSTSSREKPEEQSQVTQDYKISSELMNSSESSVSEGSTMIGIQVVPKPKSPETYKDDCYPAQSSEMWIFPAGGNDSIIEEMATSASRESATEEFEISRVDLTRQTASETATVSWGKPEEQSHVTEAYKNSSELLNSSESSVEEGSGSGRGKERETGLKSSTVINIQVDSNKKPESPDYCKEEYYSAESSGMWIFPDNTRRLCITTAGKQVIEIVGCDQDEADTHHAKKISSESHLLENLMHGTESEVGNNQKKIVNQPNSSSGLIGQVIKVAVIFGFGVLVLLTRQKEPRKKQRQENKNLFTLPDYIDERTLKPWPTATMKD